MLMPDLVRAPARHRKHQTSGTPVSNHPLSHAPKSDGYRHAPPCPAMKRAANSPYVHRAHNSRMERALTVKCKSFPIGLFLSLCWFSIWQLSKKPCGPVVNYLPQLPLVVTKRKLIQRTVQRISFSSSMLTSHTCTHEWCIVVVHTKAEVVHLTPGLLCLGVLFNCHA